MQKMVLYYLLPILSGIFIGTSYIPFPPWALLFCLTPLWLFWLKESSYKKIFFAGWLTQFILNLIGFHWIAHTVMEFGRMPWPAGFAVLMLFCAAGHLYYPLAGVLWKFLCDKLKCSPRTALLTLPLIFILCERLYPFIFYWHLGYPWLWARLPAYQLTEWFGFFGLNLITLYINVMFVCFWLARKKGQWVQRWSVAAIGLFVALNLLGAIQGQMLKKPDQNLKVLLVQGNIGNLEKIQNQYGGSYMAKTISTFVDLTRKGLAENPDVDLVIWPETAFPEPIHPNYVGHYRKQLGEVLKHYNIRLLTGAYQRLSRVRKIHNSLVLLEGDTILDSYQKTELLAFGEYLPFGEQFPQLKKMLPMISDFGRGQGPTVFHEGKAAIGAQICYEGLFDEFSTALQEKGAQVIVNVTNDSWFGYPFEPYQHMFMTLARAVENRLPLVRVTNTGISTVIHADGSVQTLSPRNTEWYKTYDVPFHSIPSNTFYAKLSDKWPILLLLLIGLLFGGDFVARTRKH